MDYCDTWRWVLFISMHLWNQRDDRSVWCGDGAAFPLVLIGTFTGAGFIMGIVILISGPQYAWAFLTYSFVQSVLGIIFGFRILSSELAQVEGVKMTNEFRIDPLVFTVLYGILLFNMQEILYVTEVAS